MAFLEGFLWELGASVFSWQKRLQIISSVAQNPVGSFLNNVYGLVLITDIKISFSRIKEEWQRRSV